SAADAYHVDELAVVETLQESGVIAVASVGHDPAKWHPPRPGLSDQSKGQLGLRLKGALRRDVYGGPTSGIGRPSLRQGQPGRHGPMHRRRARGLIGDIVGTNGDLAIRDRAERAGILAGNTHRAAPLLWQAGVIQDPKALGWALGHQRPHAALVPTLRGPSG